MKRGLLLLLFILFAGAWLGEKMVQDPGYVLVSYNSTTIETSLWVLLVAGLVSFIAAYILLRLLSKARIPTTELRHWGERRALRNAHRKTLKGLQAFNDGNWWKAQRYLSQAAPRAELPLINYLTAARAAQEQGDDKGADELLLQARQQSPQNATATDIAQAQLQFERGQFEECRTTLTALQTKVPKHSQVLRLLHSCLVQLGDWQGLAALLPELRQNKILPQESLLALELRCHRTVLGQSLAQLPADTEHETRVQVLNRAWQDLPTQLTSEEGLVCDYVTQLITLGEEARAEIFLRDQIKRNWNDNLVRIYGRLQGENAHKQLEIARKWQQEHPDNADVLLTLGRLSMRNGHWGKAIGFFEQSIALQPGADAYAELCRLLQHLGEHDRVATLLQEGLSTTGSGLPSLPMPDKSATVSA
uniref:heme biosynthesis HemY N-terminal domain-containing protein n=1 Tax=Marinobacterium profundum TaxID=1714300 RepID=UPI0008327FE6|nr:heme biosynthesis HemY N-terminal domain-containing protein [Marinobacterium profundum]